LFVVSTPIILAVRHIANIGPDVGQYYNIDIVLDT